MKEIYILGGKKLEGTVKISGSKNAALPILASTVMINKEITIKNIPELKDILTMLNCLQHVGKNVNFDSNTVTLKPSNIKTGEVSYEYVNKMRASFNLLGPLCMICGTSKVGKPGGCNIGQRPVDFHIAGLKALGFKYIEEHGDITLIKPDEFDKKLHYSLPYKSVGTTEQLMSTAALISGSITVLENVAMEPEIIDLQDFLNKCGAKISGAGTDRITIHGVNELSGCEYDVIPDRIEAGTYILAALGTRSIIKVQNINTDHIQKLIQVIKSMGADIGGNKNELIIDGNKKLKNLNVVTAPYPGFPTDLQPIISTILSTVEGESSVNENVFENRFNYIGELGRMGADLKVKNNCAYINGVKKLSGAEVTATDIRAGAALIIAGLMAEGESIIYDANHIFRGYELLEEKISGLGGSINIY
jgi:UDP-N-acetylglucosamine 1-carboxyvinyltransferase